MIEKYLEIDRNYDQAAASGDHATCRNIIRELAKDLDKFVEPLGNGSEVHVARFPVTAPHVEVINRNIHIDLGPTDDFGGMARPHLQEVMNKFFGLANMGGVEGGVVPRDSDAISIEAPNEGMSYRYYMMGGDCPNIPDAKWAIEDFQTGNWTLVTVDEAPTNLCATMTTREAMILEDAVTYALREAYGDKLEEVWQPAETPPLNQDGTPKSLYEIFDQWCEMITLEPDIEPE